MKEELSKFGLNPTEQDILLFLLRFGSRNAGVIAQKLNLKRPTVYSALENLVKANLVFKDQQKRSLSFRAAPAKDIPSILYRNEEVRFEKLKFSLELLKRPLEEMAGHANASLGAFEFQLIESHEQYLEFMYQNNCFKNHSAIWDPNQSIYDDSIRASYEIFFEKSFETKNVIREILVRGPNTEWYMSKIKNKNHICKVIDVRTISIADLSIYENDVTLLSLNNPHAELALVIRNSDVFGFMRQIFETLWMSLK